MKEPLRKENNLLEQFMINNKFTSFLFTRRLFFHNYKMQKVAKGKESFKIFRVISRVAFLCSWPAGAWRCCEDWRGELSLILCHWRWDTGPASPPRPSQADSKPWGMVPPRPAWCRDSPGDWWWSPGGRSRSWSCWRWCSTGSLGPPAGRRPGPGPRTSRPGTAASRRPGPSRGRPASRSPAWWGPGRWRTGRCRSPHSRLWWTGSSLLGSLLFVAIWISSTESSRWWSGQSFSLVVVRRLLDRLYRWPLIQISIWWNFLPRFAVLADYSFYNYGHS